MDSNSELIVIFRSSSEAKTFQTRLTEIIKERDEKSDFYRSRIVWRSDGRIVRLWTKEDIKEDFIFIIAHAAGKLRCRAISAGKDAVRIEDLKARGA